MLTVFAVIVLVAEVPVKDVIISLILERATVDTPAVLLQIRIMSVRPLHHQLQIPVKVQTVVEVTTPVVT